MGKISLSIDAFVGNKEYSESLKLRQENSSIGEIELRYTLEEKSIAQAEAEAEMLRPGKLKITVRRARDLLSVDSNGFSDPYVRLYVGNAVKKAQKTKVQKRTLNPVWDETFEFELDFAQRQDYLIVECFDWDLLGSDDPMGKIDIALDSLVFDEEVVQWHQLVQEEESHHQGEVEIAYTFVPEPLQVDVATIEPVQQDLDPVMMFGPASLEISVLSAKNLLAADRGGTSDPYVRLQIGNAPKSAQKTKVVKKTLQPEWNETFVFRIDGADRRGSLNMECLDYDLLGSDDSLGRVSINLGSLVPDKYYTEWYNLGQDSTNMGQVHVHYKLTKLPDIESSISLPLPSEYTSQTSAIVEKSMSPSSETFVGKHVETTAGANKM